MSDMMRLTNAASFHDEALTAYARDFYSLSPVSSACGGSVLERQLTEQLFRTTFASKYEHWAAAHPQVYGPLADLDWIEEAEGIVVTEEQWNAWAAAHPEVYTPAPDLDWESKETEKDEEQEVVA